MIGSLQPNIIGQPRSTACPAAGLPGFPDPLGPHIYKCGLISVDIVRKRRQDLLDGSNVLLELLVFHQARDISHRHWREFDALTRQIGQTRPSEKSKESSESVLQRI